MAKTFLRSNARSFGRDQGGNVSLLTAVALLVLIGGAALSIDLSKNFGDKSRLADASDAVALMLAKSDLTSAEEMTQAAQRLLDRKYPGSSGDDLNIRNIMRNGDEVTVTLANASSTYFSRFLDDSDRTVSVQSSAVWSERIMDIALVLDTTESMKGTRIASLKRAATDMVDTIDKSENDNVRMSVVPFASHINVGKSRRNAVWLDVPADIVTYRKPRCDMRRPIVSRSGPYQVTRSRNVDGVIQTYQVTRYRNVVRGPAREVCTKGKTIKKSWQGCVGSRNAPRDTRVAYDGRKIPGLLNVRCGSELQALTSDLGEIKSTIATMTLQPQTYMPSGLLWGWRTLDGGVPLVSTANPKTEKVLVLMTDGANSVRKSGKSHSDNGGKDPVRMAAVRKAANDKTKALCAAIKSSDITIYTIAYEVPDAATKTLLRRCATRPAHYFDARNAKDLTDAFEDIANSLNALRISA